MMRLLVLKACISQVWSAGRLWFYCLLLLRIQILRRRVWGRLLVSLRNEDFSPAPISSNQHFTTTTPQISPDYQKQHQTASFSRAKSSVQKVLKFPVSCSC